MSNALKIAPPPPRPQAPAEPAANDQPPAAPAATEARTKPRPAKKVAGPKFNQVKEDTMVQFNKRVTRRVADGYEMLAIKSRRKVPELLAEALEVLEERYGKV
jgi:hypothetical protein